MPTDSKVVDGKQIKAVTQTMANGKRYKYWETVGEDGNVYLSGPMIKDRPIQGTAADWKMLFLALLAIILEDYEHPCAVAYRAGTLKPIADVHDEIVFECPVELAEDLCDLLSFVGSEVLKETIEHLWHSKCPPIELKTNISTTWTKE
jgi:hypothetical protein